MKKKAYLEDSKKLEPRSIETDSEYTVKIRSLIDETSKISSMINITLET